MFQTPMPPRFKITRNLNLTACITSGAEQYTCFHFGKHLSRWVLAWSPLSTQQKPIYYLNVTRSICHVNMVRRYLLLLTLAP